MRLTNSFRWASSTTRSPAIRSGSLRRCVRISLCRSMRRSTNAVAPATSPAEAARADFSNSLVAWAIAEMTTTGRWERCAETMRRTFDIDAASRLDVPPNFMTIMGTIWSGRKTITEKIGKDTGRCKGLCAIAHPLVGMGDIDAERGISACAVPDPLREAVRRRRIPGSPA